jgi:hypothetical protein
MASDAFNDRRWSCIATLLSCEAATLPSESALLQLKLFKSHRVELGKFRFHGAFCSLLESSWSRIFCLVDADWHCLHRSIRFPTKRYQNGSSIDVLFG